MYSQENTATVTDNWYRVVKVLGQGYGTVSPEAWAATPESLRERVRVLELVSDQHSATVRYQQLVSAANDNRWHDKPGLHKVHGEWWDDGNLVIDGMRLYVPADRPLPVIEVEIPPELYVLVDILSRLPPDRSRAEIRALDWCCKHYEIPNILAPVSVR